MKRDSIDIILQLAYLEGRITTRGLIEKVVMRKPPRQTMSDEKSELLHARLSAALEERRTLDAMKGALTFGEYLQNEIAGEGPGGRAGAVTKLAKAAHCTSAHISRLCHETISPMELSADIMKALLHHLRVPARSAAILLENSIRCAMLGPSLASTLARYDSRSGGRKSRAMQKAVRELYIRADLDIPPEEARKIDEYIRYATAGLDE